MNKSDQWITCGLVILILLHLSIWVIGFFTHKLPGSITFLNLAAAISIIIYWIQKEISITQHNIGVMEIMIGCFELVVIGCALYAITTNRWNTSLKAAQYIFFGIHLFSLVLFLFFMLTFKINKLF